MRAHLHIGQARVENANAICTSPVPPQMENDSSSLTVVGVMLVDTTLPTACDEGAEEDGALVEGDTIGE